MAYATIADLQNVGLPAQAMGNLTKNQITAALQDASDLFDSYARARWGTDSVPLLEWDSTITQAVAKVAAWHLLVMRGINPNSTDYELQRGVYKDALEYFDKIQRQQAHPKVTLAATGLPGSLQPLIRSSSVINLATGGRRRNRGW